MRRVAIAIAFAASALLCSTVNATTWYVAANGGNDSNDGKTEATAFATIQKGIDMSNAGDKINVLPGRYSPIVSQRKSISVVATEGANVTVIDGGGASICADLVDGDAADYPQTRINTVIEGFTIQNGREQNGRAGGVYGGTVRRCIVQFCKGSNYGAGSAGAISDFENCLVVSNVYTSSTGGGALQNCNVRNCVVADNTGYGLWDGQAYNTISWGNSLGVYKSYAVSSMCQYCLMEKEMDGTCNISTNPLFVAAERGDYRLLENSPCIDAGNNAYTNSVYDIAGNARVYNGTVDIGAYEWKPTIPAGIENVTARQRYPWNGLVDLSFTVTGEMTEKYDVSFIVKDVVGNTNLTMSTLLDENGALQPASNILSPGYYRWTWNAAADLPDGLECDRVTVSVASEKLLGVVQLWENGPYWAECNVGATMPEECGYYFWWGDTVGYKRNANNDGWVSVGDGISFTFSSESCPTYGKDNSTLQSEGYIDSTGNLVSAHDAATAQLGAPWRMPSASEIDALISNCDKTWTTRNGVYGELVTGKGAYASKSIFLPAAGWGYDSNFDDAGSFGIYWLKKVHPEASSSASWNLVFYSAGGMYQNVRSRCNGQSVRPLRSDSLLAVTSGEFRLSLKSDGIRDSSGEEVLTFSTLWSGMPTETSTVTISQEGEILFYGLNGEGNNVWSVTEPGTYALAHTTYTNGVAVNVLNATFVVAGNPEVVEARSVQRYPWNGLVDIDFTLNGKTQDYSVVVSATDVDGGTNLPVRTIYVEAKSKSIMDSTTYLQPGNHRLVWDAGADISGDSVFQRVAIRVSASPRSYARVVTFDPNGGSFGSDATATNSINRTYSKKLDKYGVLPTVTREYHEFFGWSTATNGELFVSAEDPVPLSDVTLYAVWNHLTAPRNLGYGGPGGYYHSLAWDPVPGAVSYEMYIVAHGETDMSKARMTFELTENWFGSNDDDVDAALNGGDVYIRAKDADGNVGPFSSMYQGRWPT